MSGCGSKNMSYVIEKLYIAAWYTLMQCERKSKPRSSSEALRSKPALCQSLMGDATEPAQAVESFHGSDQPVLRLAFSPSEKFHPCVVRCHVCG
jgi:hypothetical protein